MYDDHFDGGKLIEADDGFSQTHIPNCSSFSMAENPVAVHLEMEQCYNMSFNGEISFQIYATGCFPETPYPELLGMYPPLPKCSSSSSSNTLSQNSPNLMLDPVYDPLLPLNLPSQAQPSSLFCHSFPNGDYSAGGQGQGLINQNGDGVSGERGGDIGKDDVKHSASERQKRKDFNVKYQVLKDLIPNPTKDDRASIVGDTVEYINELKKTVSELKFLVEKKRRAKSEENVDDDWVRRKSKNAEVDVRIMENDVSMKIVVVQHRRINCLLFVAKALDQLQLELHHVSGGAIGDFYTYFINSKICEGSNVYASAIANKVIQVVDQLYTTNLL